MRVLYLTASGHAYADKVGLNYDNIQEPDGIHPLPNEAVFVDKQKKEAIVFISSKVAVPVGVDKSFDRMKNIVFQDFLMIIARRGHRVSRIWSRRLINGIYFSLRFFYLGWFLGFIMLGVFIIIQLVTL
jgi:hypothetical protein